MTPYTPLRWRGYVDVRKWHPLYHKNKKPRPTKEFKSYVLKLLE